MHYPSGPGAPEMRLRLIISALTLALFVGLASLVSLLNGMLERSHRLDNLHREAQAITTVAGEFLRYQGIEFLESHRAPLERALAATNARSLFLVDAKAPSRPLAVWLDQPPASLLDPDATTSARGWGWGWLNPARRLRTDDGEQIQLSLHPEHAWYALMAPMPTSHAPEQFIGVVLEVDDALAAMRRQWHQAVFAILGAVALGLGLSFYLNAIIRGDLARLGQRLQARIADEDPQQRKAAPRMREFAELDRAVALMDHLERTAIARALAEAPGEQLEQEARARRRVLMPQTLTACRDWEVLTTLVGAADGAFQVQVDGGCSLLVALGRVTSDAEACNAATWWARALAWGLGPSEVWLPAVRERFTELFGAGAEVMVERFPRPIAARRATAHPAPIRLPNGLICQAALEPVAARLAIDWCANVAADCELEQLSDELDRLLTEEDGPGGALLIARLKTPSERSAASG